jgi:formamidopyrimidine-DNA glycosylase
MPELPEVEVLVRHLAPLLQNRRIRAVRVLRARVLGKTPEARFRRVLQGAKFTGLSRRGKYLLFRLQAPKHTEPIRLVGHLGMTGRMYCLPAWTPLPRHAAVVFDLAGENFVFEDTRYFGRLTLDGTAIERLGPEPLAADFTVEYLTQALRRSAQAIKVKLLDQALVAGIGNIYACEALFCARIPPTLPARRLSARQVERLRQAIRDVLNEAIRRGSTIALNYPGDGKRDGLFYFGTAPDAAEFFEERLRVYDRLGQPCRRCGTAIKRRVQSARSTYYCPSCQGGNRGPRAKSV